MIIVTEGIINKRVRRKSGKGRMCRMSGIKKKIVISGTRIEVNMERLAQAIATNHADWPAYTGKAERIVKALPDIITIEESLFN